MINSHTDSKGSAEYNLWLSEERVKSVVEYLISQGIDESRLVSKGFGETALLVKDTYSDGRFISANCQKNRRTEVEIID